MDPTTTVVLMMLNLAVTGALVALVARRSPEQRPLLQCAAMAFAAALFLRGQWQYMGRQPSRLRHVLVLCVLFGVVDAVLTGLPGQAARHIS